MQLALKSHQLLGHNILRPVASCPVIGRQRDTVGEQGAPHCRVPHLTEPSVGLEVQGLVIRYLDLAGSSSSGNCGAKLA